MTNSVARIADEVVAEVYRALAKLPQGFEERNTRNDYIAYINAYTGRAAAGVLRNEREGQDFRENMVKAAGLALSAIAAFDRGDLA